MPYFEKANEMSTTFSPRFLAIAISTLFTATASLSGNAVAASIWDLKNDWSDTTNPNGPWSLNSDSTSLPHISGSTLPGGVLVSQPGWAACSSCRGFWFKAAFEPSNIDWKTGDIVLHTQDQFSNPYDHAANVTWSSPLSGVISIAGSVWMDDFFAARGNQWNLYLKGVLVSTGTLSGTDIYDRANPYSLLTGSGGATPLSAVSVVSGDVIKLEIVRTTFDGFFVGTNLTVSAVPEPGTNAFLLLGIATSVLVGISKKSTKPRASDA